MPTEVIAVGPATAILQNVVYALPARAGRIHSLAVIEISPDGLTFDALTGAEGVGADVTSGFVRCPGGNTTVVFRPY